MYTTDRRALASEAFLMSFISGDADGLVVEDARDICPNRSRTSRPQVLEVLDAGDVRAGYARRRMHRCGIHPGIHFSTPMRFHDTSHGVLHAKPEVRCG